jgi:hypothetical protein
MKVVFESAIGREATAQLEAIVKRSLAQRKPQRCRVYISRQRTGWSVFVSGLEEHPPPVAEHIRAVSIARRPRASSETGLPAAAEAAQALAGLRRHQLRSCP